MGITILIWAAIIIAWSVKTASDQKKRRQIRPVRPADNRETDERVARTAEVPSESRYARHARRLAGEEARRNGMTGEPIYAEEFSVEATDSNTTSRISMPKEVVPGASCSDNDCPARSSAAENSLGEPFDLRRAVIYSEILKPKFEE